MYRVHGQDDSGGGRQGGFGVPPTKEAGYRHEIAPLGEKWVVEAGRALLYGVASLEVAHWCSSPPYKE